MRDVADYRGDCWKGYLEVSLLLRIIRAGDRLRFVCDAQHVEKMLKVIDHNDGRVEEKLIKEEGVYFTVIKKQKVEWTRMGLGYFGFNKA